MNTIELTKEYPIGALVLWRKPVGNRRVDSGKITKIKNGKLFINRAMSSPDANKQWYTEEELTNDPFVTVIGSNGTFKCDCGNCGWDSIPVKFTDFK
jgi:hypothetical protein